MAEAVESRGDPTEGADRGRAQSRDVVIHGQSPTLAQPSDGYHGRQHELLGNLGVGDGLPGQDRSDGVQERDGPVGAVAQPDLAAQSERLGQSRATGTDASGADRRASASVTSAERTTADGPFGTRR